jgi:prevent-host-death family protein
VIARYTETKESGRLFPDRRRARRSGAGSPGLQTVSKVLSLRARGSGGQSSLICRPRPNRIDPMNKTTRDNGAVSVADAKKHLSELLGRVAFGREMITISKRGQPMARLVPVSRERVPHLADVRGWLKDSDPFFSIMDEIAAERHSRKPRSSRKAR